MLFSTAYDSLFQNVVHSVSFQFGILEIKGAFTLALPPVAHDMLMPLLLIV
jgi:hypothetical protein